jgi:hypothetical protein
MSTAADAQAFETPVGKKLLVVNKRNFPTELTLPPEAKSATVSIVDETTGDGPARLIQQDGDKLNLAPFAVAVVTW